MADPTGGGYQQVVVEEDDESLSPDDQHRQDVEEFLSLAHERYRTVEETEAKLRQNMLEDLRFRASEQWPDHIRSMREKDNRPCLTINRMPSFIRQVTNNQRASRPAVQVSPTGDEGDPGIAEVLQGIVRHIETKSDADVAYTTAGDHQVTMGRGYVRVVTDYIDEDPLSMNQEIKVRRIPNPFSVYVDPSTQNPDGSDARYAFIVEDIPTEEYRFRYPDSALAGLSEFTGIGNTKPDWMPEGNVRVAEYFYIDEQREEMSILEMSDGSSSRILTSELESMPKDTVPRGFEVVGTQDVTTRTVRWCLINAVEILEGNDEKTEGQQWPGKYIPIVPVTGDEININGVRDYRGVVRDSKDPQRMYNYWVSAQTEMIALAPRAPFVGAEGQFAGHERKWEMANVRNYPYLEYKQTGLSGQLAPPPQRQSWEPPIQAMTAAIAQSDNDLKATGGFNDASLGQRGPQESGRAIRSRQQQDEMANSHYLDNLGRAVRQVGRILVDLIPKIYDTSRVLRILGDDERPRSVMVFAGEGNRPQEEEMPPGVMGMYDVGVGRYDVNVAVGPSFQTRRQEAVDAMTQLVQAYPNVFPVIGDLLFGNMDVPMAKEMEARLKKSLPEHLQDEVDPNVIPPEVQAQMQQMQQQMQQVMEAYEQAQEALKTQRVKEGAKVAIKERELAASAASQERDLQARVQLEQIKQQGENARALANLDQKRASEVLQTEIGRLDQMITRQVAQSNRDEDRFDKIAFKESSPPGGAPLPPAGGPPQGPPPGPPPGPPQGPPQGPPPGPPLRGPREGT